MDSSDDDINDRVDFDLAELQGKNQNINEQKNIKKDTSQ